MTLPAFVAATAVIVAGAILQGTIGFGLALLAAPLLHLIDARLVPGPLMVSSAVLTVLMARREWHAVRGRDLGWSLAGRVAGTVAAVAVLSALSARGMDLLFGGLVLAAVALTAVGVTFRPTPRALLTAGAASGFMGTATSIGGPPIALVYQHETGARIRGTLSAFFVVGVLISVAALAAVGRFGWLEIQLGGLLIPGTVLGYWLSHHTAGRLQDRQIRPAVLIVSGGAAIGVILRELLRG
jgi:hypothetical protein